MRIGRWIKFASAVVAANSDRLKYPFKLFFVVTKECHSRCANCKIWQEKPQNELTIDEIRQLAQNSPFLAWLDLSGGEPTDRSDFVEIVRTFIENCPQLVLLHFPTNGLRPDRIAEICREVILMNPPRFVVTVSVDGPPEVNDGLRGVQGDFELAVQTYAALRSIRGVESYVGMTLYPKNTHLVEATVEAIQKRIPEFGIRDLHLNLPNVSSHYYGNEKRPPEVNVQMLETVSKTARARGIPRTIFEWVERFYHRKALQFLKTGQTPMDCSALSSTVYLAEDGTVFPCSIWNEPLGNIRVEKYSLLPILAADQARKTRKKVVSKDCPNCWTPCEAYPAIASSFFRPGRRRP